MNRYKKSRFGAFGTFRSANPRPGYSAQGGFPVIVLLALCLSHHLFGQKKIEFADKTYEPQIKTVLLYSGLGNSRENLRSAVVPLQQQSLVLEFDDLQENSSDYYVKLIHCNYDWTKSTLMDLDFLESFNENRILDYAYSINTHTRYVHYHFQVPPVKLPGNYLLVAYREDPNDLILSKRLMVYQNQVSFSRDNQFAGTGTLQRGKQPFNFDIEYSNLEILNPMETVHVTIRQNQRWDNMKTNLQPNFIRENTQQLEYRFFDIENQFDGGNEFRFVDFRSLMAPGQNTGKINRTVKPYELYVALDQNRSSEAYSQYLDLNGNYVIANLDFGEPALTGNYLYVNFLLKSAELPREDVYVVGSFNDFQRDNESKMSYNGAGYYESRQFLKQGLYNYQYEVGTRGNSTTSFEGNHFETENFYEIFVYQRPFRPNADLLVGYFQLPINPR